MIRRLLALALGLLVVLPACGSDDGSSTATTSAGGGSAGPGPGPGQTGAGCKVDADCYPGVADATLPGARACLDDAGGGYCSYHCQTDADCCGAVPCPSGIHEVCTPFESNGGSYCMISCETADVGAGYDDVDAFCAAYGARDFTCRSSGGGSDNRKICAF